MITHERLKELIEQGATIYFVYNGNVDLKEGQYKDDFILNETYVSIYWSTRSHQVEYENLFETLEEANWHKEFKRIPRTDYLDLPTWEEFDQSEKLIRFIGKYGQKCKLEGYNSDLQSGFIDVVENGTGKLCLSEYSKENYLLACRKAKELFLGEEK